MCKNVTLICDLQFGSCGKGSCAGYLAMRDQPDTVVTAWSPNAGHTFIDANGRKFVHCMLANGIVSPKLKTVMIAPGSTISLARLVLELGECRDIMHNKTLVIHKNAAIVFDRHLIEEGATMTAIGSTKKGSGAALVEKLRRQVPDQVTVGANCEHVKEVLSGLVGELVITDTGGWVNFLGRAERIQVEGAQGFSLGVNSGFYPYCTSRECTPSQIMSDCLISPKRLHKVVGVMRTYPIRVANRYDTNGNMVGWSGPCYPDQKETSFEEIGREVEVTTVTKLPRRIFNFSWEQSRQALLVCAPDEIFLSFCDYIPNHTDALRRNINSLCQAQLGAGHGVRYMAWGPKISDVTEVNHVGY